MTCAFRPALWRRAADAALVATLSPWPYRLYLRRRRAIFIHIPKTAGTAVLRCMGRRIFRDHCTWYEFYAHHPARFAAWFKFSVVRDPWQRLLSFYRYMLAGGNGADDLAWRDLLRARYPHFEGFVMEYCTTERIHQHRMLWPQSLFIHSADGRLMVDRVLRFENLAEELPQLAGRLRPLRPLPPAPRPAGADWREQYNDAMIARVGGLYERDIRLLGYAPP